MKAQHLLKFEMKANTSCFRLQGLSSYGILTKLVNGVPVVDGNSSLEGLKVGFTFEVTSGFPVLKNPCTGEQFTGYETSVCDFEQGITALHSDGLDALFISKFLLHHHCDFRPYCTIFV